MSIYKKYKTQETYAIIDQNKQIMLDTIRKDKYESWDYITKKKHATVEFLRRKREYSCVKLLIIS